MESLSALRIDVPQAVLATHGARLAVRPKVMEAQSSGAVAQRNETRPSASV